MKLQDPRQILAAITQRDDWYRIVNRGPDHPAELYLYDEIGYFGTTAASFVAELRDIDASQMDVFISSVGGSVVDGIAIYNALRTHDASIRVQVDSMAASIASVIVQAGDTREMMSGSQMYVHNAFVITAGDADELRAMADILDKQSGIIADIYAERSGEDAQTFRDLMDAETLFTATEAVNAGLADTVITTSSAHTEESDDSGSEQATDKVDWAAFVASATQIGADR